MGCRHSDSSATTERPNSAARGHRWFRVERASAAVRNVRDPFSTVCSIRPMWAAWWYCGGCGTSSVSATWLSCSSSGAGHKFYSRGGTGMGSDTCSCPQRDSAQAPAQAEWPKLVL